MLKLAQTNQQTNRQGKNNMSPTIVKTSFSSHIIPLNLGPRKTSHHLEGANFEPIGKKKITHTFTKVMTNDRQHGILKAHHFSKPKRKDGQTDRRTDRRMDGQTYGLSDHYIPPFLRKGA
ncbi:hypothetical protein DPMN_063526 [Dreissena polymorpha]|uniref:Uncharacterized protein n=1 Tax=Dreissena polymorpha TaxID=45954 RepID=A0A9D4CBI3_DREPO|nr:hypothetical protein DPMN_063526 [Dreissena polymorpha]